MGTHTAPRQVAWKQDQMRTLHPAWMALVRHCKELSYGEIERLKIQNGLPMMAETIKKRVKFT